MPKSVPKSAAVKSAIPSLKAKPSLTLASVDGQARKRGRPPKLGVPDAGAAPALTRELILDRATAMAKVEPLDDISMVGLARELGVAPTLIHYYIGSRNDLISGVANRYFRERHSRRPRLTGNWKQDLKNEALLTFEISVEYGGVIRYIMGHNRFRLFQQVSEGETDYGMLYLDRMGEIFRNGGFTPDQSALGYLLLMQYVTSASYAEISRQLPAFHTSYIRQQIESQPEGELQGARYVLDAFSTLDTAHSFPQGLEMLIDSFEAWLKPAG